VTIVPMPNVAATPGPGLSLDAITLTFPQRQALSAPHAPLWWLNHLSIRLQQKRFRTQLYWDYYHGSHRLLFASAKFRMAFGTLFSEFADNWCRVIVDTRLNRLAVTGFRVDKNSEGDDDAWEAWQANQMDHRATLALRGAYIAEESAIGVWPGGPGGLPSMVVMDPSEVTVVFEPDGVTRRAALRMWIDPFDGAAYANVYLKNYVWKFRGGPAVLNMLAQQGYQYAQSQPGGGGGAPNHGLWLPPGFAGSPEAGWQPNPEPGEPWPLPNPMGRVPVVPLINRPRINGNGESALRDIVPIQDAINKTLMDGQINSEFTAFPQRWMIGEVPRDAEGNPTLPFDLAADKLLFNEDPAGSFGDFKEASNSGLKTWIDMLVSHIASMSSTPVHYFAALQGTQFPSGDALRAADAGLTSACRQDQRTYGEPLLEVTRLQFLARGDEASRAKAAVMTSECLWADPEYKSESEHADYLSKIQGLGISQRTLWERAGLTPAEIARQPDLLKEQAQLAAELALINPPAPSNNPNTANLAPLPGAPAAAQIRGERITE
jgi:hypothetical protein